MLLSQAIPGFF